MVYCYFIKIQSKFRKISKEILKNVIKILEENKQILKRFLDYENM